MSERVHQEDELRERVPSAPHLFRLIKRAFAGASVALLALALVVPAPLDAPADPGRVPNPVKSAWFLLWTQELVSHSKALVYLLVLVLVAFLLLPWWPGTRPSTRAGWFQRDHRPACLLTLAVFLGIVGLTVVAVFFRGQNWAFVARWPELAGRDRISDRPAGFAAPDSPLTERGVKLLDEAGCRRCHTSGGRGNGLAADLDRLLPGALPGETVAAIQEPALLMPRFAFTEAAATAIASALFAFSAAAPPREGETPRVVHFEKATPRGSAFDEHCGGCHRMLTRSQGGLGAGAVGPNLSGLFGEYYPTPFQEGERWAPANLERWVRNPRAIRRLAGMPPLLLADRDWGAVLAAFEVPRLRPFSSSAVMGVTEVLE